MAAGIEKTWTLPIALLHNHSGYFKRLQNFKEGIEGKVTLKDFEPEIFELFVQFIYFDKCTPASDTSVQIWTFTKAWVLADYLDAHTFRTFSWHRIFYNYYLENGSNPSISISPDLINYSCSNTKSRSPLQWLYLGLLIRYWQTPTVVLYNNDTIKDWTEVWNKHPEFLNALLLGLSYPGNLRDGFVEAVQRAMGDPVKTKTPPVVP